MEFLDRVDERKRLERFLRQPEGAMACLYGRRRIGKSRLLEAVLAGRADVAAYCADRSEAALQRARMAEDFSFVVQGGSRPHQGAVSRVSRRGVGTSCSRRAADTLPPGHSQQVEVGRALVGPGDERQTDE